jgi:predicted dehydrogenase
MNVHSMLSLGGRSQRPFSRRSFLKTGAATAVVGAVATQIPFTRVGYAAGGETLKIGLIGCGGRGTGAASQALKAHPSNILTAVGDVFPEKCARALSVLKRNSAIASRVKANADSSFSGLDAFQKVIDSGVDVVLLATPPGFRPQHFVAAVKAGKHIFAEKPLGTDVPGALAIRKAAEEAKKKGLAVASGFCWRAEYGRRAFYQRVHEGALGELRAIYATYLTGPVKPMPPASKRPSNMGDVEWQIRNWYNFVWLCGDGIAEQACHSVDKISWAMQDQAPARAVATGGRDIPNNEGNIFDHVDVFYEWDNGVRATMAQRQIANCYSDNSDYLMGAKGLGTIKGWSAPIITGENKWRYHGPKGDMYQVEHNELFASIRAGKPINQGHSMTQSTLMAIMGRNAAYTGQMVTWEQVLKTKQRLVPENLTWDMKLPIRPMAVPGKTRIV